MAQSPTSAPKAAPGPMPAGAAPDAAQAAPATAPPRKPTVIDVARAAGVSPATVSNALNDRRYVDAGTRESVREAARRLGYTPNLRAQRLRTGQADSIALLSAMPFAVAAGPSRLGFLMEIAAVTATLAIERGLALVLVPPLDQPGPALQRLGIDGALVLEPLADDPNVAHLRARGVPVVTIGRQPGAENLAHVDLRSGETATLLLDHLRAAGARRTGLLIGGQPRNSYVETEAAYREFAACHGMPALVRRADEREGEAAGEAMAAAMLAEDPALDALCVPVDAFAVGAVRAVRASGRRVPEDVRLATRYDGLRARNCDPPLTAVDLHLDRIAELAVELMLEQLAGAPPRVSLAPLPDLVPRRSSVPAA
ncbi:substrate-binding domain-containing protein [Roseomonas sp. NAR14]|uniref:Substrate-binding domain-containing protein n=1 Tax=Roseomonas acroporae TaxID=2937791 RepID=A0A9X1YDL6_9PROT|nr:substrate-binding domain-containing protein [Roseomonas acroporae]MCK8787133.1 substrate-binding domain-containing protein [Roseomonas acroporae]